MFFLVLGVQLVFLFSIFDIYFKSPIVNNVIPYQPQHLPVAERLVLFVVDGLRAESFLNYTTMPYLRSIANSYGRWGISNTRVPTESRPGHVAVIAGFYEDPSAVAKGWKENPVDFDSVFNQTQYTWCWGTYDILEIFAKETGKDHIFVNKFDPYEQTFSTDKNTTLLDAWVFENAKTFFNEAENDAYLMEKLHQNKVAFFFHLLGTDTAGHKHKPKTEHFLTTVRFADEGIKELEKVIKDFYNDDGKTTFLMTSDHGMTDWGSHGAGDDHETQTPYVLWGAGVQQVEGGEQHVDTQTEGLSSERRFDINQADLTPLMSTILSIPVPVNSIGQLPVNLLKLSLPDKAKAIYSNSRQLAAQYNTKRLNVEQDAIPALYHPFAPFDRNKYQEMITFTESLMENGEYEKLILLSEEIMHLSLTGLTYYHNYYQKPLLIFVTLSFVGWIAYLLKNLLEQQIYTQDLTSKKNSRRSSISSFVKKTIDLALLLLGNTILYLIYVQNLPVQYYLYFLMPLVAWWYAMRPQSVWIQTFWHIKYNSTSSLAVLTEITCYTMGSVALAFSFTYRWMLSVPLLGMAVWPFFSPKLYLLNHTVLAIWIAGCTFLSIFSFMPVIGKDAFIELVILAGILWLIVLALYIWKGLIPLYKKQEENLLQIKLIVAQMFLLSLSLQNIYAQSKRFERGTPVSHLDQSLAWIIAVISILFPIAHSKRMICRLMAINTSIFNFYLLLSVAHEGLFMVVLISNVLCWVYIEYRVLHKRTHRLYELTFAQAQGSLKPIDRSLSNEDFRRAFFFLLYIILAFFGTGNIASLNSFEVRWVTCFITSFQPFVITGLILLKTLSPFLCVGCSFRAVQNITKAPIGYLNIIVLIYTNIMGIQLLYYVRNTGSWLEIGTSISQFVIVQVITLFIILINQVAKILTDINIYDYTENILKIRKKTL